MARNQTVSYLRQRFAEVGIQPDSRHGQNFLIDLNLVQVIVDAAELSSDDVVLEIGTGTGSLTALMAERAAAVITVEIDAHLFELGTGNARFTVVAHDLGSTDACTGRTRICAA